MISLLQILPRAQNWHITIIPRLELAAQKEIGKKNKDPQVFKCLSKAGNHSKQCSPRTATLGLLLGYIISVALGLATFGYWGWGMYKLPNGFPPKINCFSVKRSNPCFCLQTRCNSGCHSNPVLSFLRMQRGGRHLMTAGSLPWFVGIRIFF